MNNDAGNNGAEKAVSEPAAAVNAVPQDGSAKPSSEVQKRIDELTGEKARKDEQIAALKAKIAEITDAQKSADEKRMDQLIAERVGPDLKRKEALEAYLTVELEEALKAIPESAKAAVLTGESVPVEERLRQARAVAALIGTNRTGQPFTAGAVVTGEQPKRQIPAAEFRAWQNSSFADPKGYDAMKAEMQAAFREGRIVGL